MQEKGVRFIIGSVPLLEIPDAKHQGGRSAGYKLNRTPAPSPATTTTTLYGFKIQPMANLGQTQAPTGQSFWETVLGALQPGCGFEIPKKDFNRARNAILKYNKLAKSIWKMPVRKFVLEKGINAQGEPDATVGRVGRMQ